MCKAKKRIQNAHGYLADFGYAWPRAGTTVNVIDNRAGGVSADCVRCSPIGITVTREGELTFFPWASTLLVHWREAEDTAHGSDDVENVTGSAGIEP